MKALILSNHSNTSMSLLEEEMMRRGYEVHTLYAEQETSPSLHHTHLKWQAHKKYAATRKEWSEALQNQLESNFWDVIISGGAICADIFSGLSEKSFLSIMIYISDENDPIRRRQAFSCDAYIVRSDGERKDLLRRGVRPALIHLLDAAQQEPTQICSIIEDEVKQWEELKRAFDMSPADIGSRQ